MKKKRRVSLKLVDQESKLANVMFPRPDEIYLAAFITAQEHEIQTTRPAVIIQNDVSNQHSPITIVAAVSSQFRDPPHPREVRIPTRAKTGLSKPSAVILNQLRSIDRARLRQRLGVLDAVTMQRVDEAIKISLGLIPL